MHDRGWCGAVGWVSLSVRYASGNTSSDLAVLVHLPLKGKVLPYPKLVRGVGDGYPVPPSDKAEASAMPRLFYVRIIRLR